MSSLSTFTAAETRTNPDPYTRAKSILDAIDTAVQLPATLENAQLLAQLTLAYKNLADTWRL